jgi:hypothetical protein
MQMINRRVPLPSSGHAVRHRCENRERHHVMPLQNGIHCKEKE